MDNEKMEDCLAALKRTVDRIVVQVDLIQKDRERYPIAVISREVDNIKKHEVGILSRELDTLKGQFNKRGDRSWAVILLIISQAITLAVAVAAAVRL